MGRLGWILAALLAVGCFLVWLLNTSRLDTLNRQRQDYLQASQQREDARLREARKEVATLEQQVADLERQQAELDPATLDRELQAAMAKTAQLGLAVELRRQHLLQVERYWREIQQMKR
jgi:cell division protein FtsB